MFMPFTVTQEPVHNDCLLDSEARVQSVDDKALCWDAYLITLGGWSQSPTDQHGRDALYFLQYIWL